MPATPHYREVPPPTHLAADLECLWVVETGAGHPGYRVLPDGCMDLVVQPAADGAVRLDVVGAMTEPRAVPMGPAQRLLGLRFRPGMAYRYLPLPADELADRTVPFAALGTPAGTTLAALARQLAEVGPAEEALRLVAAQLVPRRPLGPVQRLCAWLSGTHGQLRADEMAAQAGLSGRQLRRLFLAQVGLGPKQLARILRFQRALALARAAPRPDWAGIAVDCGYVDQAHLVHEFGTLAGCSPGRFGAEPPAVAVSYNPSSPPPS